MKLDLILLIVYTAMFLLMTSVALATNSIVCEILSMTWGIGLLILADAYEQT
jgi:hypothetical protein